MDKAKILVVEDDPFLRKLYTDILKAEQYDIDSAVDGSEALVKIKQGGWDLILLDIIMPKVDGLQVIEKLKQEAPDKLKQQIVFLTNLDKNEMVDQATKLGFDYLIKSNLNPEEFLNKIKNYITK